jgi:hypothetical protein
MSKDIARTFSRAFRLKAIERMDAGENVSALSRELGVKREITRGRLIHGITRGRLIHFVREAAVRCRRGSFAFGPVRAGRWGEISSRSVVVVGNGKFWKWIRRPRIPPHSGWGSGCNCCGTMQLYHHSRHARPRWIVGRQLQSDLKQCNDLD